MPSAGEIYSIAGADKVLIKDLRIGVVYPFDAPNWVDLRIGFFLSLTDDTDDNLTTGLSETKPHTNSQDRAFIGVKDDSDLFPSSSQFIGFSNMKSTDTAADSIVETINSNKQWRVRPKFGLYVRAGTTAFNNTAGDSFMPRFSQDFSGAGTNGRAILAMIRLTRNPGSFTLNTIETVQTTASDGFIYQDANVYSDAPTLQLIRDNFRSATFTSQLTTKTFSVIPNAIYAYWPFQNSRLRIHSVEIEKFS